MRKGFSLTVTPGVCTANSFIARENDNLHLETEIFEFLLEGVLLNRKKLLQDFALKDQETLIKELYFQKKEQLISYLEGEFRGYIIDKVRRKLFVFTNITSTQRIFSGIFNSAIFIDSSLIRLNDRLRQEGITTEPNVGALYQLLCFNNMLESSTPVQNIDKLLDGHYLEIDLDHLAVKQKTYFTIAETPAFTGSKDKAIDAVDQIFSAAIELEYSKDLEYKSNHLALLSGGLDSRVALMYALKNGYLPGNALCFSHAGYYDHHISKKIAADYHIHYEFIALNDGSFLNKVDQLTEISEGMVAYTGGIHVQHAVEQLQYQNFGLFHSGQIGDGILGGFLTESRRKKPDYFKIVSDNRFLPKVQTTLDHILQHYETEETFLLRNVAYNRTILGAQVFQQKKYQTSPFMNSELLRLAISLPESWKFQHRFYIEWINKHCKEASAYQWERTLLKPNAAWKTAFGDKVVKRAFNLVTGKILCSPQHTSMYPYQYYFDGDAQLQVFYEQYFEQNIHLVEQYKELAHDVRLLFAAPDFISKSKAVNILSVFKLFFAP